MKRKGLPIWAGVLIVIALLIAIVVIFVIQTANNGWVIDTSDATKAGLIAVGAIITLVRIIAKTGGGRSLKVYESSYKNEIRTAFSRPDKKKYKKTLLKAMALYNEQKYTASLKLLGTLSSVASTTDERCVILLFEALNCSDAGMTDDAIKKYETLLKYDEKRATAWSNLGILYKDKGKKEEAFECYGKAVEHDSENAYAWNNLAQAYLSSGEWKKVIEPAEKSLALKSNMYQAESALCVAYFALGEREKSKKYFDLAVLHGTKAENLSAALSNLAQGYFPFDDGDREELNDKLAQAVGFLHRDTAKPMVQLRLPAPEDKNKSRIGGAAVESDAPLDSNGNKMRLLAAIWCSEVHGVPYFPESGVLRFYVADNDFYGADFDEPCKQTDFRVLYDENEEIFNSELCDDPEVSSSFPVQKALPLRISPNMSSVLACDYRFKGCVEAALKKAGIEEGIVGIPEDAYERICDENSYGGHRIGGYPCFEQQDPRGYREDLRKYDTLLLQIVSHTMPNEDGVDEDLIMFGDEGSCQFFIPRDKLIARDFSDVMYWWDCG